MLQFPPLQRGVRGDLTPGVRQFKPVEIILMRVVSYREKKRTVYRILAGPQAKACGSDRVNEGRTEPWA